MPQTVADIEDTAAGLVNFRDGSQGPPTESNRTIDDLLRATHGREDRRWRAGPTSTCRTGGTGNPHQVQGHHQGLPIETRKSDICRVWYPLSGLTQDDRGRPADFQGGFKAFLQGAQPVLSGQGFLMPAFECNLQSDGQGNRFRARPIAGLLMTAMHDLS